MVGTGNQNTNAIVNSCGEPSTAARYCYDLTRSGYSDWYLPSETEVYFMYLERARLNVSMGAVCWSSKQETDSLAFAIDYNGQVIDSNKKGIAHAYPIRSF